MYLYIMKKGGGGGEWWIKADIAISAMEELIFGDFSLVRKDTPPHSQHINKNTGPFALPENILIFLI